MENEYLSDWDFVLSLLPAGWKEKVSELKLMKFGRKFSGEKKEENLLRVLMMHLADGLSLRTTATQACLGGIANISDVGIYARLRKSAPWFLWCIQELQKRHFSSRQTIQETDLRFIAVDASTVKEPGATGSLWNFHYAMNLLTLSPKEILLTDRKTGERFCNFQVRPKDLFIGDRAYAKTPGLIHVHNHGGYSLCRFSPHILPLYTPENHASFPLLSKLRKLEYGEIGEWDVEFQAEGRFYQGRVCAMKKSPQAAQKAKLAICQEASKKQRKTSEKTLEFAEYILIFTTLPQNYSSHFVLQIYRLRWQIELFFKRLKSILGVGHLPKYDDECAKAYLCGKLFVAMLIEIIARTADDFFPWSVEAIT